MNPKIYEKNFRHVAQNSSNTYTNLLSDPRSSSCFIDHTVLYRFFSFLKKSQEYPGKTTA